MFADGEFNFKYIIVEGKSCFMSKCNWLIIYLKSNILNILEQTILIPIFHFDYGVKPFFP